MTKQPFRDTISVSIKAKRGKTMSVGSKIKELRKEKGLTQSDLSGDAITRNMLSCIESGKATPSLDTLLFLAERLGVSVSYLLDEERTLFEDKKAAVLPKLKAAYQRKNYKEVLRLYERDLGECDDEIAYLLTASLVEEAKLLLHKGKLLSAEEAVKKGLFFAEKTVYDTEHFRAALLLLRAILGNVQAPKYEVSTIPFSHLRAVSLPEELYRYVIEKDDGYVFENDILGSHMKAKAMMAEGRYADALYALEKLEERRAEKDFSVFVLFRIYGDLEVCHKELRNYEAAYRYSAKRMSLLSAFRA